MKNKIFSALALFGVLGGVVFMTSCGSDDASFAAPTIGLSTTAVTAAPGEDVEVEVDFTADAGFKSVTVTKLWDGVEQGSETVTDESEIEDAIYVYTVTEEDADHILTINFTITDAQDRTASVDLVITVELTPRQMLLKYNWQLSEEIREATGEDDISQVYTDDVYRFNEDGTYDKSIGSMVDDFNDIWYNYCFWDLNDNTLKLLMSRTGAFGEEVTDTLNITVINDTQLYADVTYYGLDVFNTGEEETPYEPVEEYEKRFVAVAKVSSFDPYQAGAEDDESGPANMCAEVTFEND